MHSVDQKSRCSFAFGDIFCLIENIASYSVDKIGNYDTEVFN